MANRPRRNQSEWQTLVNDFTTTQLSARQFCDEREIPYASFLNWKRRLTTPADPAEVDPSPAFIDLGTLTSVRPATEGWRIELALGDGVVLKLERG